MGMFADAMDIVAKINGMDSHEVRTGGQTTTNPAIVYFSKNSEMFEVQAVSSKSAIALPDVLVIPPGTYSFAGNTYAVMDEGLYRFVVPGEGNLQRIVYKNSLNAFLSSISWIVSHGNIDDKKSVTELSRKALSEKLFITCGTVSKWAQALLHSIGIKSRLVGGITVDTWNTYDNGHLLIEVWQDEWNKWVVVDLDNNSYFLSIDSEVPLSVMEWSALVAQNQYRIESLANDSRLDISGFRSKKGYDFGFFAEALNADIHSWYRRVMQVPFIYDEKERLFRFMAEEQKVRVEAYSANYKYMEKSIFMQKYYSGGH
jgi:hypothetical protein